MQIAIALLPKVSILDAIGPYGVFSGVPDTEVVVCAAQEGRLRGVPGQDRHRRRGLGRHRPGPGGRRQAERAQVAQATQLNIEYDPQPPFDTGSPSKAPQAIKDRLNDLIEW